MKNWQLSGTRVLFHILWLFSGFSWSQEWQYYSICTSQSTPGWAKNWIDSVGLDLELSKGVILKKCSNLIESKVEQVDVLINLNGVKEPGFANMVQMTIYSEGIKLEEKKYTKEQLLNWDTEKYAEKFRQKIAELHSQYSKQKLLESLVQIPAPTESDLPDKPKLKRAKWILNADVGIESWFYDLHVNNKPGASNLVEAKAYPELIFNVEWWPISWFSAFATGNFSFFALQMQIEDNEKRNNDLILGKQYHLETGFKLRHVFSGGFGLGLKAGYWMQIADVDRQKYKDKYFTQLPSFTAHALVVGGEIYYKSLASGVDALLELAVLPVVQYQENPDTPGVNVMTFGAQANFRLRYFFDAMWFVEGDIGAMSFYVKYEGDGSRLATDEQVMAGGVLYSYKFSGLIGLGVAL